LEPFSAPGCDEPTSRCQTTPSIGTLKSHQPVIPGVPFIRWAMTLPHEIIGSLGPTFVSVRHVCLTVKQAFTLALHNREIRLEPTFVHLRYSLGGDRPSQTSNHALFQNKFWLAFKIKKGWSFTIASSSFARKFYRLPPKLHILFLAAIQRSSQGAQGLSV